MKRFFGLLVEITKDALHTIQCVIEDNLMNLANITNFALPYVMYFVGQDVIGKDKFVIGYEMLIPLVLFVLIYYISAIRSKNFSFYFAFVTKLNIKFVKIKFTCLNNT